jgi:hypothetical protein
MLILFLGLEVRTVKVDVTQGRPIFCIVTSSIHHLIFRSGAFCVIGRPRASVGTPFQFQMMFLRHLYAFYVHVIAKPDSKSCILDYVYYRNLA